MIYTLTLVSDDWPTARASGVYSTKSAAREAIIHNDPGSSRAWLVLEEVPEGWQKQSRVLGWYRWGLSGWNQTVNGPDWATELTNLGVG